MAASPAKGPVRQEEIKLNRLPGLAEINKPETLNMKHPSIKSNFKWDLQAINPFKPSEGGIDQIKKRDNLFPFTEMYPDSGNNGLKLNVNGTGILEMD